MSFVDRFWSKVDRRGIDDCWLWMAAVADTGYGVLGFGSDKILAAHRVSWELKNGPIGNGAYVLHRCDDRYAPGDTTYRRCVNDAHLWLGDAAANMADMAQKGRSQRGERHVFSKLTDETVREARRRIAAGEAQFLIAADLKVSKQTISDVKRGDVWRHVE